MEKKYLLVVVQKNYGTTAMLLTKGNAVDELTAKAFDGMERTDVTEQFYANESERTTIYEFDTIGYNEEACLRWFGFRKCDDCGRWINPQQLHTESRYMGHGIRYCSSCYAIRRDADFENAQGNLPEIEGYHDSRDGVIYYFGSGERRREVNSDDIGVGIELEFDGSNVNINSCRLLNSFNAEVENGEFRFERDGSLDNGFEIISNVWSIDYMKNKDFRPLARQMQEWKAEDDYSTSGFHVHISHGALGDTLVEQKENMLKLKCVLFEYWDDFVKMSGRTENGMYYCSKPREYQLTENASHINNESYSMYNTYAVGHGSGGCALISDDNTIEWRIFKSTSNAERISMILNFIVDLTRNIKNVKWEDIYILRKLLSNQDKSVLNYWHYKGCFTKSHPATGGKKGEAVRLGY